MTDMGVENEPTAAYLVSLIGGIIGIIASFILIGTGAWIGSLTNEFITFWAFFGFALGSWHMGSNCECNHNRFSCKLEI